MSLIFDNNTIDAKIYNTYWFDYGFDRTCISSVKKNANWTLAR